MGSVLLSRDGRPCFTYDGWFRISHPGTFDGAGYPTITVVMGGTPDPVLGERVCPVMVPAGDHQTGPSFPSAIPRVSGHRPAELPERIVLVDELPKTASGKVQRFRLRAAVAAT